MRSEGKGKGIKFWTERLIINLIREHVFTGIWFHIFQLLSAFLSVHRTFARADSSALLSLPSPLLLSYLLDPVKWSLQEGFPDVPTRVGDLFSCSGTSRSLTLTFTQKWCEGSLHPAGSGYALNVVFIHSSRRAELTINASAPISTELLDVKAGKTQFCPEGATAY